MLFLTSRYTNDIYKLIVDSCAKHYFKKNNKYKILKIDLVKKYDKDFLFYLIKKIITGEVFSKKKLIQLSFEKVNFGRYLFSISFRDVKSYQSNLILFWKLFKNIILISMYFYNAKRILKENNFKAVYLDHCFYLNGIFYEFFMKHKKVIYTNNYPADIISINSKKKISIEESLKIKKTKKILTKKEIYKTKKIHLRLYRSQKTFYNWMQEIKYKKTNKINFKKFDFIIYAHSFADAQLAWGYDGFINIYEWLDFTINELIKSNKSVLVKAHPNFYLKNLEIYSWERKIFLDIIDKYKNFKNIEFINFPVNNYELMKKLNSKCIGVTHHGSVGLELLFNNFKVISSANNFYDRKYKISNQWDNPKTYKKLLNLGWNKLKKHSNEDFLKLTFQMLLSGEGYFGKNFHLKILNRLLIKENIINKNNIDLDFAMKKFNKIKNKDYLINKINLKIKTLS
jgi:hypothetical protein